MGHSRQPIILWDIDGTLLAAGAGGLEHYHRAIQTVIPDANLPELSTHGKTDWQIILELLEIADISSDFAPEISACLDEISVTFLNEDQLTLLPNAVEVLKHLDDLDVPNGLLTGNSERRSRNKLRGAGLDLDLIDWATSFFGSRSLVRKDIALAARAAYPERQLLIVGDTPFDGVAAKSAGIPFLAVCTGNYGVNEFAKIDCLAVIDGLGILNLEAAIASIRNGKTSEY